MKKLILIGGTMGVGKSATGSALAHLLPRCAFLDGDWCWTFHPDCLNEETKGMVMRNIHHLLREYLRSQTYENVVFVWVMHEQAIWDDVLRGLAGEEFELQRFALTCSREAFESRFLGDVQKGIRKKEAMAAAWARMERYAAIDARRVVTDGMSVQETAQHLLQLMEGTP